MTLQYEDGTIVKAKSGDFFPFMIDKEGDYWLPKDGEMQRITFIDDIPPQTKKKATVTQPKKK